MDKTAKRQAFLRGVGSILDLGATQISTTRTSYRRHIPGFEDDARAMNRDGQVALGWGNTVIANEAIGSKSNDNER